MIVDSSALVAIVLDENSANELAEKLASAASLKISAVTLMETSMVLLTRGGPLKVIVFDALLKELSVGFVAVDQAMATLARQAFHRYGKGRHPAGLNFGDCFVYALARESSEPLLFVGDDFSKTDLLLA